MNRSIILSASMVCTIALVLGMQATPYAIASEWNVPPHGFSQTNTSTNIQPSTSGRSVPVYLFCGLPTNETATATYKLLSGSSVLAQTKLKCTGNSQHGTTLTSSIFTPTNYSFDLQITTVNKVVLAEQTSKGVLPPTNYVCGPSTQTPDGGSGNYGALAAMIGC